MDSLYGWKWTGGNRGRGTGYVEAAFEIDDGDTLYHYTDAGGLAGIVNNACIWASDYQFLNDTSEAQAGRAFLEREVERRKQMDPEGRWLWNKATRLLEAAQSLPAFVCSFSEQGDSLSQWRAYGKGGTGFAVGFHRAGLILRHEGALSTWRLVQCLYSRQRQERFLTEMLDRARTSYKPGPAAEVADEQLWDAIRGVLSAKNEAFKHEYEWRMVSRRPNMTGVHLRAGSNILIPYVEIPFDQIQPSGGESPIRRIVVGPTPHLEEAAERLCKSFYHHRWHPDIIRTSIPYRHW